MYSYSKEPSFLVPPPPPSLPPPSIIVQCRPWSLRAMGSSHDSRGRGGAGGSGYTKIYPDFSKGTFQTISLLRGSNFTIPANMSAVNSH